MTFRLGLTITGCTPSDRNSKNTTSNDSNVENPETQEKKVILTTFRNLFCF